MKINLQQFNQIEQVLFAMVKFDRPADAVLTAHFRANSKLGATDRHLIAETAFACLRHLETLRALCGQRANTRKLALATLVRIGGANLRELDGIIKETEREWLSSLKGAPLPDALTARAALPQWVLDLLPAMPEEDVVALGKGLASAAPLDIRVNTLKLKRDDALVQLQDSGVACEATPYSPIGIRLKGKPSLAKHPLFVGGAIEVQDEGSQLLGLLTGARRGEMVVDFCAGAGGKTLLLGAQMASTGRLYAFDVSEKRLANFKPRMARSGLSNVNTTLIAHENDTKVKRLAGKADRVLVDAPCSGLGTLRRNPDLKYRQSADSVAELNAKQQSILASAARLVKAGGRLVYATCSLLPQENQAIVEAFLAANPAFELVPANQVLAEQKIPLDTGDYLALRPHQHNTDGFFAAVLQRKAGVADAALEPEAEAGLQ
ncbi:RsmB/NOP family class I SAM-dependent RNA methyltransferase [Vogesella sp. LYT5W]|uniref:RsmB/NOP family class I SAM-dependent RNA methyltransferase n=1 Tax=Vogesella margarita TaxID=2984199 RepID=A0ABT5IKB9_9NEIS|nr:RsmB/NOP family class I SAM-dependent RNA methyltransferase [Vogesella margarita]MDC7712989.1 RsmB/NOP family class I SAM-dependent RNA methyltransferase [Vogesella margarita]